MNIGRSSRHMMSVDLTPMIDVVLQLIIFFMLTSRFGDLRRTEVDLPRQPGEEARQQREPALIVDLTGEGVYLVDSQPISLIELQRLARSGLATATDSDPFDVLVRPDRNARAVHLDRLLADLASVGINAWKLGTTDPGGSP